MNDINKEILHEISKFADDTKIFWVNTLKDIKSMERILNKLVVWTKRGEMKFNIKNCKVMYIEKRNLVSVS